MRSFCARLLAIVLAGCLAATSEVVAFAGCRSSDRLRASTSSVRLSEEALIAPVVVAFNNYLGLPKDRARRIAFVSAAVVVTAASVWSSGWPGAALMAMMLPPPRLFQPKDPQRVHALGWTIRHAPGEPPEGLVAEFLSLLRRDARLTDVISRILKKRLSVPDMELLVKDAIPGPDPESLHRLRLLGATAIQDASPYLEFLPWETALPRPAEVNRALGADALRHFLEANDYAGVQRLLDTLFERPVELTELHGFVRIQWLESSADASLFLVEARIEPGDDARRAAVLCGRPGGGSLELQISLRAVSEPRRSLLGPAMFSAEGRAVNVNRAVVLPLALYAWMGPAVPGPLPATPAGASNILDTDESVFERKTLWEHTPVHSDQPGQLLEKIAESLTVLRTWAEWKRHPEATAIMIGLKALHAAALRHPAGALALPEHTLATLFARLDGIAELARRLHPYTLQALTELDRFHHHFTLHSGAYYVRFARRLLGHAGPWKPYVNVDPHEDAMLDDEVNPVDADTGALNVPGAMHSTWAGALVAEGLAPYVITVKPRTGLPIAKTFQDGRGVVFQRQFPKRTRLPRSWPGPVGVTVDFDTFSLFVRNAPRKSRHFNIPEARQVLADDILRPLDEAGVVAEELVTADSPDYVDPVHADGGYLQAIREMVAEAFNARRPRDSDTSLRGWFIPLIAGVSVSLAAGHFRPATTYQEAGVFGWPLLLGTWITTAIYGLSRAQWRHALLRHFTMRAIIAKRFYGRKLSAASA